MSDQDIIHKEEAPKSPRINEALGANFGQTCELLVATDGTTTTAEIVILHDGGWGGAQRGQLGFGKSRRRKGDRRDQQLGQTLAIARAVKDAYERLEAELTGRGYKL